MAATRPSPGGRLYVGAAGMMEGAEIEVVLEEERPLSVAVRRQRLPEAAAESRAAYAPR